MYTRKSLKIRNVGDLPAMRWDVDAGEMDLRDGYRFEVQRQGMVGCFPAMKRKKN